MTVSRVTLPAGAKVREASSTIAGWRATAATGDILEILTIGPSGAPHLWRACVRDAYRRPGDDDAVWLGRCVACSAPRKPRGVRTTSPDLWNNRPVSWCPDCGGSVPVEKVAGTFREDKPCTARCMAAVGPSCECFCGGANHGGRWSG